MTITIPVMVAISVAIPVPVPVAVPIPTAVIVAIGVAVAISVVISGSIPAAGDPIGSAAIRGVVAGRPDISFSRAGRAIFHGAGAAYVDVNSNAGMSGSSGNNHCGCKSE
jgi:hypothetical protein